VKLCSREFKFGVLRKIYGPKREAVAGDWKNFILKSSSPSIIQVIKSRRMMCTGHVTHTGQRRNVCRVLMGKAKKTIWKTYT
jgi:hypothetical protein